MNVLTLSGTTAVNLAGTPFVPAGRNTAIVNLSGAAVQPQATLDGTNFTNWGAAVAAATIVQRDTPQGARAIRLAAAGAAFVLSAP